MFTLNKIQVKPLNIILYVWLFLWAVNFMGMLTDIAMIGGVILILLYLVQNRKISYSFFTIFYTILTFGVFYSVILNMYHDYDFIRGYREFFFPVILYTVGFLLINRNESLLNNLNCYKKIILIISFGLFIYATLNLIFHLNFYGDVDFKNRLIYDIWSGDYANATSQGSKLTLITTMIVPILLVRKFFKNSTKLILISAVIASLVSTLIMANRSLFVIVGLSFIASLILYLKNNVNNQVKIIRNIILFLIVIAIVSCSIYLDMFGVRSYYEESNLSIRLDHVNEDLSENSRIVAWVKTISGLSKYPMGGSYTSIEISSPHNLWLDVAYTTGIIPFALLIIITVFYLYYLFIIINNYRVPDDMKIFIFSSSIALLLNLSIEPIFAGHYFMYMVFILQLGMMHGLVEKIRSLSKNGDK